MEITNKRIYFFLLSTLFVCIMATSGFVINKRSIHLDEEIPQILDPVLSRSNEFVEEICHISVTCAWEVYRPFKRTFEYLIKNTCECPSGYSCVKSGEDLSISAYIYKCQLSEPNLSTTRDDDNINGHPGAAAAPPKST